MLTSPMTAAKMSTDMPAMATEAKGLGKDHVETHVGMSRRVHGVCVAIM